MIAVRIASGITAHLIVRFKEWVWGIVFVCMGLQLLRAGDTFAAAPIYRYLTQYAEEDTWGAILFCMGVARIIALCLNGTFGWFRGASPVVRAIVAFLSAGVWFALGLGFFLGFSRGITAFAFWGLTAGEIHNAWVIAGEAGIAYRPCDGRS